MGEKIAGTLRKRRYLNDDSVRDRIQTTQLILRLQKNALGELEPEMTPGQIASAKVVLAKKLPDLQQVDITAQHTVTVRAIRYLTESEWLTKKATPTLTIAHDGNSSHSTPEQNGSQLPCVIDVPAKH